MASTVPSTSRGISDSEFRRSLLNSIALFRGVDPDEVADVLLACGRIDVEKGKVILSPNADNQCVYVLLSGELAVHIGSLQSDRIATLAPGSCTGEMSIIDDRDPSAFVVATEDSHLMVISYQLMWDMVERSHAFAKNLLVVLSERVRADNAFIANSLDVLRRAEQNATTDALTGLGNRHWMDAQFQREISRLSQSGEPACLLMLDIDGFKDFNDQYGHIAGDNIINAVGQVFSERLRTRDLIARFGGDEFAVLLPAVSRSQGFEMAERLRGAATEVESDVLARPVTVSIGITTLQPGDDLTSMLDRADRAMYDAKAAGRDQVAER